MRVFFRARSGRTGRSGVRDYPGRLKKAGICLAVEESDQKVGYRLTIEKAAFALWEEAQEVCCMECRRFVRFCARKEQIFRLWR